MVKAVIMDFGGVLAEEGFREGLKAIARARGLDPERFYETTGELVYTTGYVTGKCTEAEYWQAVKEATGITDIGGIEGTGGPDPEESPGLSEEILSRFTLRPEVMALAGELRSLGFKTALLSDQTDWLDELNKRRPFFHLFGYVFNSFVLGKSKQDPSVFTDVCTELHVEPKEAVFIDDNPGHIERASAMGLKTILYIDYGDLDQRLRALLEGYEAHSVG